MIDDADYVTDGLCELTRVAFYAFQLQFIGGYEAVQEMEDAGCLTEALQAASAA